MKVVNADYGIDTVAAEANGKTKWYRWHRFPLLPIFSCKPADKYNESSFTFSWLFLRVWSLMSPDLEIGVAIEDIGGYFYLRIPYLKIVVWFLWFPESWRQKLWRRW